MQLSNSLLALPTAVILLLCVAPVVPEKQWPHNLPKHMKYFPEDEVHVKRGLSIQERMLREKPVGVKKMSGDEGEMFFFDNWIFVGDEEQVGKRSELEESRNSTIQAFSPLRPHFQSSIFDQLRRFAPRDLLSSRGFQCPEGTSDCSSIGAPNSCCGASDVCMNIPDNGFGTVACCPKGQTCAGAISCDTGNGYTSCPSSPNGGCCLPGYSCLDVGCVTAGTSITYVQPSTPPPSSTSTAVVVVPTTPPSAPPTSTPVPSSSSSCSSGWFSCPQSLNGGCCQNGLQCASGTSCIDTRSSTGSVTPSAPVRPTSGPATTSATPTSSDAFPSMCPTGFYVCSAYYPSGCCRVGRDCQTTGTCIPTSSATVIVSNGVTIVAPTGASFATTAAGQGGSCPIGWYSCAASLGGNCCLDGYSCGAQCTSTSGGNTQVAAKVAPNTAEHFSHISIWALLLGAIAIGIGKIPL
ncbi:uncharacterized protein BDR25DRAFT_313590 [Lindgomyces ingoldianus]|uniref:Uncharacterized protein n=1 Tax=Lindgomyces ingoldianus TaxID=673940 RepID=A0ACB6QX93_9PLEO|nr:uncharacterized protein BDR25DRAFT_313590 [Lindgomyces ingoldianus]KAF2471664.1 hypothetical protein BDR25DRAFT_313590 [Lindgomyces ingoldianus]